MMVEVEWLESLVIGPLLQMVVLCGYILTNGNWFHTYFIWNFWSTVGPPFGQNKSNSFEIHLNNSQLSLFIQARPTPFLSWVGPRAARPSLPAPLPLPAGPRSSVDQRCLTVRTRRTALVRRGRAAAGRCHAARAIPCRARAPISLSHSRPPCGAPPQTPYAPSPLFLLCRAPSAFKSRRPPSRFPLSPSLCFSSAPDVPSPPSSLPVTLPPLPSPNGETHQSIAIFRFGAALTSLVLTCSSQS
jgi:hypothetical protein